MTLGLDGRQRGELRRSLTDAFRSWADLAKMCDEQLNVNLAVVAAESSGLDTVAFQLVNWAKARGLLADLIVGARNQNPGNSSLARLAAELSLSSFTNVTGGTLEALVSRNTVFLDSARWRVEHARNEWRVCRVDQDGRGKGTGFLVTDDLVLTNQHVVQSLLADPATASVWRFRFDHKLSERGDVISMGREVALAAEWRVDFSPPSGSESDPPTPDSECLDYALLRLAEPVGRQPVGKGETSELRGFVAVRADPVDYAAIRGICILQHPGALPMKLAIDMTQQLVFDEDKARVRHTVPTLPGSSGSPVFDPDWRLVALHQGTTSGSNPKVNQAIPIHRIAVRPKVAEALGS